MMSERDISALWLRARRSAERGRPMLSCGELKMLEEILELPEQKRYQKREY